MKQPKGLDEDHVNHALNCTYAQGIMPEKVKEMREMLQAIYDKICNKECGTFELTTIELHGIDVKRLELLLNQTKNEQF